MARPSLRGTPIGLRLSEVGGSKLPDLSAETNNLHAKCKPLHRSTSVKDIKQHLNICPQLDLWRTRLDRPTNVKIVRMRLSKDGSIDSFSPLPMTHGAPFILVEFQPLGIIPVPRRTGSVRR